MTVWRILLVITLAAGFACDAAAVESERVSVGSAARIESATPLPMLVQQEGRMYQTVRVAIDRKAESAQAVVSLGGTEPKTVMLRLGVRHRHQ
mgnify:CR=1 FL=1